MKHSAPFWSWNGELNVAELKRQMRYFKKMGLGGVFMHSRTGLKTKYLSPKWFKMIKGCIEEGRKLGLKTWLYDEDRWPSGYAGGYVTKHEKHQLKWLYLDECKKEVPPAPGKTVREFHIKGKHLRFTVDSSTKSSWYNDYCYANILEKETAEAFLKSTHEKYLERFDKKDFPGVFTDEPQYGFYATLADWSNSSWHTVPYSPRVRELIKKRYHYDIFDYLPELFLKELGGEFNFIRNHYIETITELFRKNYIKTIGDWHKEKGLIYTGHMMGEDSLIFQTWNCGDAMSFYPYFGMPGIDQLGADSFNHLPPRQLGSAARQYGQKDRLVEMYGCAGWDYPPEGQKLLGDLLLGHGVNFRCQHLAHYTLEGESKRDCPASVSFHIPWTEDYHLMEERSDRLADQLYNCDRFGEVLVISPVESLWGMGFVGFLTDEKVMGFDHRYSKFLQKLQREEIPFDLGSEILLSETGKVANGQLFLGKIPYKAVVLPEMETIRKGTLLLLQKFAAAGGEVIFSAGTPKRISGEEVEGKFPLASAPWEALEKYKKWKTEGGEGIIYGSLYTGKGSEKLFLTNTSCKEGGIEDPWRLAPIEKRDITFKKIRIHWKSSITLPPCGYDPDTDSYYPLAAERKGEEWIISTSFDRLESRLFVLDGKERKLTPLRAEKAQIITPPEEFSYSLHGKNLLVLDKFHCRKLGKEENYILDIDNRIREKLEIPVRSWNMVQPWAAKKLSPIPEEIFILEKEFESELKNIPLEIAVEAPSFNTPFLNGVKGTLSKGKWYMDKAFRIFTFPKEALQKGKNLLTVEVKYNEKHPGLEAVYLLGDFAVTRDGKKIYPLPEKLRKGNWIEQGLPYFNGGVKCRFTVVPERANSLLSIPSFAGCLIRVKVGGRRAGVLWHAPYSLDISKFTTPGKKAFIELELVNSPRNMLGPFYVGRHFGYSSPQLFTLTETEEKALVPLGFL